MFFIFFKIMLSYNNKSINLISTVVANFYFTAESSPESDLGISIVDPSQLQCKQCFQTKGQENKFPTPIPAKFNKALTML